MQLDKSRTTVAHTVVQVKESVNLSVRDLEKLEDLKIGQHTEAEIGRSRNCSSGVVQL